MELSSEFTARIDKKFAQWRRLKGKPASVEALLGFLLAGGFISESIVKRWLVLELYPEELEKTKTRHRPTGSREQAILAVSGLTGVSRTHIQTILAHKNQYFKVSQKSGRI